MCRAHRLPAAIDHSNTRSNMSKSIHTTYKDIKGLTKKEIDNQVNDPDSDLAELSKKSAIKKSVIKERKLNKKRKE